MSVRHKILFIDGNSEFLRDFSLGLALEGYLVTTATNGQKASEILQNNDFDVLITNLRIPGCDGTEILCQVCERGMLKIVVSESLSETLEARCRSLGCKYIFEKPLDCMTLISIIRDEFHASMPLSANACD